MRTDFFATFAQEGGRVGSGALTWGCPLVERSRQLGGGLGGVGRCA